MVANFTYTYSKEISTQPLFLHFHLAPLEQCSAVKVLVYKLFNIQRVSRFNKTIAVLLKKKFFKNVFSILSTIILL